MLYSCSDFFCVLVTGINYHDVTVSKRNGTSDKIEIQFRTFIHLSRPDSFVKLFGTFCLCLGQGNKCLGQI